MIYVQEAGTMEAGRSMNRRKILHEYLIEVLRDTSLQGLAHFTYRNRHPLEYLAWAITIIAAMGGAISICLKTWNRYQISPIVIAMEFNYLDWGVDSPSSYICPSSVVEENLLYEEAQAIVGSGASNESVMYMARFLETAVNATYNNFWKLQEFENDTSLPQSGYLDLALKMKYNLTYYSTITLDCTLTEMGFCYAFNSKVANITSPDPKIRARSKNPNPMLKLTVFDKGVFTLITSINSAFTSYLQSPNTIPNIVVPNGYSVRLGHTHIKTTVMETYATPAVRSLSVNQRKCRYDDESPLKHSPVYSINHCKQQCRMDYSLRLCGCLPFFYNISTEPTCNVTGMLCLAKHNETLIYLKNFTTQEKLFCPCLPSCERFDYTIVDAIDTVLDGLVGVAILKAEVVSTPHMRIRRDVLFSNTDLMGDDLQPESGHDGGRKEHE